MAVETDPHATSLEEQLSAEARVAVGRAALKVGAASAALRRAERALMVDVNLTPLAELSAGRAAAIATALELQNIWSTALAEHRASLGTAARARELGANVANAKDHHALIAVLATYQGAR